ncbi:MAG: hypothetical protein ABIT38_15260 [Gemmatimonadaceae bacterium]
MSLRRSLLAAAFAIVPSTLPAYAQQRTPIFTAGKLTEQQQLARDIYKELVEINTGVTTGDITVAAQAMAKRFRAAGIPESDIFVGGPEPK